MNRTEKSKKSGESASKILLRRVSHRVKSAWKSYIRRVRHSKPVKFITKKETKRITAYALKCIGMCVAGFMLGSCRVDYMSYPLGLALVAASGRLTFFAYAGSAIASLTYPTLGFAFFGVNTLIYIIRKILLSDDFCESGKSRIILSFFTSVFICLSLTLAYSSGTFDAADSHSLISCFAVYLCGIPLACFLLYPAASDLTFSSARVKISLCFFCMCIISSCATVEFFGKSAVYLLACLGTLIFCTFFEGYSGIPASALFGIATLDTALCAPLTVSAFMLLRYKSAKPLLSFPLFFVTNVLCTLFLKNGNDFRLTALGCLFATLSFFPVGAYFYIKNACTEPEAPVQREAVSEAYTGRMSNLASAFGAVSKVCFGFSGRMRFPSRDDAEAIVTLCSSTECRKCAEFASCKRKHLWNDPHIAEKLTSGKLIPSALPGRLGELCHNSVAVTDAINEKYRRLLSERFNNNKTEILAYEYATLAKILKYTSRVSSEDVSYDGRLTRLACSAVKKLGLTNTGVTVYGSRRKTLDISGVPVSQINMPSERLAAHFSAECSELFADPEFILDENNTFTVRMVSKETVRAEYVKVSHTKSGETVNGDTVTFFKSDDSFFYALIADGMGSGRDAAMTSRLTSVFVEKLLSGGAGKGVTMELLNNLLMSKSKECFSSVDLLEIDLIRRRASFVKAGAAPTYLLRSAKLFKVSSETPPCGIVEGFCAENTSFEIFPGDIIIMLSDGITSSIDCGTALCDIMNKSENQSFESLANKILDTAVSLSVHDDDMSCVLVKVK